MSFNRRGNPSAISGKVVIDGWLMPIVPIDDLN